MEKVAIDQSGVEGGELRRRRRMDVNKVLGGVSTTAAFPGRDTETFLT